MDLGIAMRRAVLCLAVMLLPSPALADGWTAQMEEDEGGPVMVASITASADGNITPELRLMCAGSEGVMLRYLTAADTVSPGSEANFLFENENSQITEHMQYEDMDGAFAAYFPPTDKMIEFLKTGDEVFISESSGNYPAQTFPLKGSSKAIDTLLKTCSK
jgi:hypothetical protein